MRNDNLKPLNLGTILNTSSALIEAPKSDRKKPARLDLSGVHVNVISESITADDCAATGRPGCLDIFKKHYKNKNIKSMLFLHHSSSTVIHKRH